MKRLVSAALASALLIVPTPGNAQEVAPYFEEVPAVMFETYGGVSQPAFTEYFEMLVAKYTRTGGIGWTLTNQNAKTAHRVTALPDGLASMLTIQQARAASAQEFSDADRQLFDHAWSTRHLAVYNAVPELSYVPEGFSSDDIGEMPFVRTLVYHLKWDQQAAFRAALARRGELDREAGIDNLVLVAWNGGVGTETPVIMLTIFAADQAADLAALAVRNEIRDGYREAWAEQNRIMLDATLSMERADQNINAALSYAGNR
jgi:hypothetical protein